MKPAGDSPAAIYGARGKPVYLPLEDRRPAPDCGDESPYAEEDVVPRRRTSFVRRPSLLACAAICSVAFLAFLFALNTTFVRWKRASVQAHRNSAVNLDDILKDWGRPGSGTEDIARYPTDFLRDVVPIPCHSHNDYWRRVPLFSAIHAGCIGVEADVWLYNGELYVGHDTAALQPNRTFRSLYVDPLVQILERQNPSTMFHNSSDHGVFDTSPYQTLVLLVDLKTAGEETWPVVLEQLEPLRSRGWLANFDDGKVHSGPITVVGTGNTPFNQVVANPTFRDAFFDAPLDKLAGATFDSTNSYYASVSFKSAIGRLRHGRLSPDQLGKVRRHVEAAHRRGLKARYWNLPAWPIQLRNHVWDVLVREGVDILNVDDLMAVAMQDWSAAKPASTGSESS